MTFDEYAKIDAVNWSTLREMRRSPKHYQYRRTHPREDTAPMALGRAAHCAVLEPDRFALDFAVFKGPRRAGKAWDAFEAANEGRTILKIPEYEEALAIRDAVRSHPVASEVLKGIKPEQTLTWADEGTGLACKGRLDGLSPVVLADIKSTSDLSPRLFAAQAARLGIHCQLAFYVRGLKARGIEVPVKIIAVESKPPHDVGVFTLDEDALFAADEEIGELLSKVATCEKAKTWPGRFPAEEALQLPAWAFGAMFADDEDVSGLGLIISQANGEAA